MEQPLIVVVGSTNMDMVVKAENIPVPGETIMASSFFMNPGGKGANQAVAIARLGGRVAFISKLGNDVFGKQSTHLFDEEGIDTRYLLGDLELPSGVALITVDNKGENSIVVAAGANANLRPIDVDAAFKELGDIEIILMQLEIPIETVKYVAQIAKEKGIRVVLNPAPFQQNISRELLCSLEVISPNQTEAEMLSGKKIHDIRDAEEAAISIHELGVPNVIVTMGYKGAVLCEKGKTSVIPTYSVEAIDTTAAGDVFNGALVVAMSEGKPLEQCVKFACKAASISVTRMGAQSSIPFRNELILEGSLQI